MKHEKIVCIVFLILALFISLVLSGLPFLVSYSKSSLPIIEGVKFKLQTTTPSPAPTPTVNAMLREAQEKYKILDGVITNIANYAITESGKEKEILIEKNNLMNAINEFMSVIQTGKTTNGIDATLKTLSEMLPPLFTPFFIILEYTNFLNKFKDPNRRTTTSEIHKNLSIFESNIFDIFMLTWRKIV